MRSSDVLWADMPDYFRKAAGYADKIPNGAKHADASLAAGPSRAGDQSQGGEGDGLTIPQSLLVTTDEVIE